MSVPTPRLVNIPKFLLQMISWFCLVSRVSFYFVHQPIKSVRGGVGCQVSLLPETLSVKPLTVLGKRLGVFIHFNKPSWWLDWKIIAFHLRDKFENWLTCMILARATFNFVQVSCSIYKGSSFGTFLIRFCSICSHSLGHIPIIDSQQSLTPSLVSLKAFVPPSVDANNALI